jgi:hypothetical protein
MTELMYPITYRDAEFANFQEKHYRLTLTREWDAGRGMGLWLLSNPSTASAEVDDPTTLRVVAFSQRWGLRRAVIVNGSPLVTPDPKVNSAWLKELNGGMHATRVAAALARNRSAIKQAARRARMYIAAFGAAENVCLDEIVDMLRCYGPLHCIGTTEAGRPKHPLARGRHRVPVDAAPVVWREQRPSFPA